MDERRRQLLRDRFAHAMALCERQPTAEETAHAQAVLARALDPAPPQLPLPLAWSE
jgi:hypothetical protein